MLSRMLSVFVVIFASTLVFAEVEQEDIQQRIAPVGQVNIESEDNKAAPSASIETPAVAAQAPGEATYDQYCTICHAQGVAGAPKFRNAADWGPRVTAKKLEGLLQSSKVGLNAMPAKGTCATCSDEELKAAISYMLPQE